MLKKKLLKFIYNFLRKYKRYDNLKNKLFLFLIIRNIIVKNIIMWNLNFFNQNQINIINIQINYKLISIKKTKNNI